MHPGPMNRGVEIDSAVADGPSSTYLEQVTNGLAVRMAVLYELLGGAQKTLLTQHPDGTIKLSKSDGTPSGGSATGRHANHLVSPVLSFGEWNHIAIYFSNGETSLYLNEKRVDTVNENLLEYLSA